MCAEGSAKEQELAQYRSMLAEYVRRRTPSRLLAIKVYVQIHRVTADEHRQAMAAVGLKDSALNDSDGMSFVGWFEEISSRPRCASCGMSLARGESECPSCGTTPGRGKRPPAVAVSASSARIWASLTREASWVEWLLVAVGVLLIAAVVAMEVLRAKGLLGG